MEYEDDVPTFGFVLPEPVAHGTQATDVDGDEWVFDAAEDAWVRIPVCSICYDPSVGTYGPSNEPLCGDCRDEEGFCSCGDVLKDCDACNESESESENE